MLPSLDSATSLWTLHSVGFKGKSINYVTNIMRLRKNNTEKGSKFAKRPTRENEDNSSLSTPSNMDRQIFR